MKTKIMLLLLSMLSPLAFAQQFSDKIKKEISFEKPGNNAVMIFNISGNVTVTGYSGTTVVVEVDRVIHAKTDRRLELGKEQVQLRILDRADSIIMYVEGPCNDFGQNKSKHGNRNARTNNWGYQWNNNHNSACREEFDYEMHFTVKIPVGTGLYASTINNGDVAVENVTGSVLADNINGSISLKNITGATYASTINGSVDLEYAKNPPDDCRYYSLNGDINAFFRKGLTANISFESFNGELYTNIDQVEALPSILEKKSAGDGIKYKVGNNRYRIGKGGVLLDFETFNGNVYLKETLN